MEICAAVPVGMANDGRREMAVGDKGAGRRLAMDVFVVFFFQAEDGIRDYKVTGVQTCALPIFEGEFGYGEVTLDSALHQAQLQNTHDVLMSLSDDSLLKPFRQMAGQRAPGEDQIGRASCRERV